MGTDMLLIFDTTNNNLTAPETRGSPPSPRCLHGSAVWRNSLFIFGGSNGNSSLNDLYQLRIEELEWEKIETE